MEEVLPNGETKLTDGATQEDILRAMDKMQEMKLAQLHVYQPGEVVTLKSGARYRIDEHGSWVRLEEL